MNNNFSVFGDVFLEGVKKTWNNKDYINFRKMVLKNKKDIELCRDCPGTNKETFINIK